MRRPLGSTALVAVALLAAGCGGDDDVAAPLDTATTAIDPAEPAGPGGPVTTAPPVAGEGEGDEARVVELAYAGGQVTSQGGGRIEVAAGEVLVLQVTSDVDEEVHVHGYDIVVPLTAGETAAIEVVGDLPGVWEVELHDSGTLLTELAVAG